MQVVVSIGVQPHTLIVVRGSPSRNISYIQLGENCVYSAYQVVYRFDVGIPLDSMYAAAWLCPIDCRAAFVLYLKQ